MLAECQAQKRFQGNLGKLMRESASSGQSLRNGRGSAGSHVCRRHHGAVPLSPWVGGQWGAPQPWPLWCGHSEHGRRNRGLPTASSGSGCWCPALVRISRKGQGTSICFLNGNGLDCHTSSLGTTWKQRGNLIRGNHHHPRPWGTSRVIS